MVKLKEQIREILARKDRNPQQKLFIISCLQQPLNKLKEKTNSLTGLITAKDVAAPKVDAIKGDSNKPTPKQQPVNNGAVKNAV